MNALTMNTISEYVMTSATLAELRNRLIEGDRFLSSSEDSDSRTLDELVDLTSLPTFGGQEPADTNGIFSWDENSLLRYTGDAAVWAIEAV